MRAPHTPAPLAPAHDARRRAWLGAGSALGIAALAGCACGRPRLPLDDVPRLPPGALAPPPPHSGSLELPVVIDAHCHIFNVEDVPASAMLKGPIAHTLKNFSEELLIAFADLIAAIAYVLTPSVRAELALLEDYVEEHRAVARTPSLAGRDVAKELLERQRRKFARAFAEEARNPRFLKPFLLQMQAYHRDNGQPVESRRAGPGACPAIEDGEAIDAALGRLYAWCVANNVPVMAHTSHSFGPTDAHDDCATPYGWQVAIEAFEGLRMQAGHFGGGSDYAIRNKWAAAYAAMAYTPQGWNLYADLSNLDDLFVPGSAVGEAMEPLYEKMAQRMAYGSDWYMTELQDAASTYVAEMSKYLGRIEGTVPGLRKRVFGLNAATLYGLAPAAVDCKNTNWCRLVAYYEKQCIPPPRWMRKLCAA